MCHDQGKTPTVYKWKIIIIIIIIIIISYKECKHCPGSLLNITISAVVTYSLIKRHEAAVAEWLIASHGKIRVALNEAFEPSSSSFASTNTGA